MEHRPADSNRQRAPQSTHPAAVAEPAVHLSEYIAVLRRRWRLVAGISLGAAFLTGVVCLFSTPIYEGNVSLQIGQDRTVLAFSKLEAFSQQSEQINSEIEILKSRTIAEKVVRELNLQAVLERSPAGSGLSVDSFEATPEASGRKYELRFEQGDGGYTLFDQEGESLGTGRIGLPFEGAGLSFTSSGSNPPAGTRLDLVVLPFEGAVGSLRSRMTVRPKGRTNLVLIRIEAEDSHEAAKTANAVARAYIDSTVQRRSEEASATRDFVRAQLESIQGRLRRAEQNLSDYKSEVGIMALSQDAERILEPWTSSELELGKLKTARQEAESILELLRKPRAEDAPPLVISTSGIPDPLLGQLASRLTELELRRAQLAPGYQSDHPVMRGLEAEIARARQKVSEQLGGTLHSLLEREQSVAGVIDGYRQEMRDLPSKELGLAERLRESRVTQDLYRVLQQRLADAEIAKASTIGNAWIVDQAIPARRPSRPSTRTNVLVAGLFALFFAVGLVFLLEYMDRSVRSAQQLEQTVGLATYGVIPEFGDRRPRFGPVGARNGRKQAGIAMLIGGDDASSYAAEAYRSLRTNIRFASPDSLSPVFLVTSAVPGEGKSLTVANLGISLAEVGKRVLLVDGDLRRPMLHRLFEVSRERGLSQVLAADQEWKKSVLRTHFAGVDLIPGGEIPPNPAELLASSRMIGLIRELREAYDVVIIDSPPVVPFTDATVLGTEVDGVFLVVRSAVTNMGVVARARRILVDVGARVLGAVLNRIRFEESFGMAGYSKYYYYYYYYDQPDEEREATGLWRLWFRLKRRWRDLRVAFTGEPERKRRRRGRRSRDRDEVEVLEPTEPLAPPAAAAGSDVPREESEPASAEREEGAAPGSGTRGVEEAPSAHGRRRRAQRRARPSRVPGETPDESARSEGETGESPAPRPGRKRRRRRRSKA